MKFLDIFELFGTCGNLIYCSCEVDWQKINFKNRCILCGVYSTHVFIIIHVDTFHGSKGDFPAASYVVASLKIWNNYIVANLSVKVLSAEDCCASSMKFSVPKKVVLFIIYLSIILTLFILSTLFLIKVTQQDHTHIYILYYCNLYLYYCNKILFRESHVLSWQKFNDRF